MWPNIVDALLGPVAWPPLTSKLGITGAPRKRNMAKMKEQIKTPKIELSDEERANLSDAEFKTLVTRMLTELIELGHKMKEEMKATQKVK